MHNAEREGFARWQWAFPVAVLLHHVEEAITMPVWMARHAREVPWTVLPRTIWFGLAVLTIAAVAVTYLSFQRGKQSLWAYLLFGFIVAMLVNVFVPHVPAAVLFRGYAPGVVTAVLVNLPVMGGLAIAAVRDGWVAEGKAVLFAVAVPLGLAAMIGALFWIGGWVTRS